MDPYRKTAIIVGALFITATVAYSLGVIFLDPILGSSDYLTKASENENQVLMGSFLVLIDAISVIFIAMLMFPILKKYNEGLALGYIGLRIFEGIAFIVGAISILSLLTLSQKYLAGTLGVSLFQALGTLLIGVYDWTWIIGPLIFFALSTLPFYYLLYQSKLIPRWLSGWGFIGGVLIIAQGLLAMFGLSSMIDMFLFLPIDVQEMVLAVWLIAKGFK